MYSYMHDVVFHFTMCNQDVIVYAAVLVMFTWCTRRLVATDLFPRRVVCHCQCQWQWYDLADGLVCWAGEQMLTGSNPTLNIICNCKHVKIITAILQLSSTLMNEMYVRRRAVYVQIKHIRYSLKVLHHCHLKLFTYKQYFIHNL
jgi:hypothetical protein